MKNKKNTLNLNNNSGDSQFLLSIYYGPHILLSAYKHSLI